MTTDSRLLTVAETAERLGVHRVTIHDWIKAGLFPGSYQLAPGRKSEWRIPERDVTAIETQRLAQQQVVS